MRTVSRVLPSRRAARSRCGAGADRCRHIVLFVPRESPSVVSGLFRPPKCALHPWSRATGGPPLDLHFRLVVLAHALGCHETGPRARAPSRCAHRISSRWSCAALLHDIKRHIVFRSSHLSGIRNRVGLGGLWRAVCAGDRLVAPNRNRQKEDDLESRPDQRRDADRKDAEVADKSEYDGEVNGVAYEGTTCKKPDAPV